MSKSLNITRTRLKALEYLATKTGGVYVSALTDAILTSEYRRKIKSGFTAQQSTRSGAGCAVPLIRAGGSGAWGLMDPTTCKAVLQR